MVTSMSGPLKGPMVAFMAQARARPLDTRVIEVTVASSKEESQGLQAKVLSIPLGPMPPITIMEMLARELEGCGSLAKTLVMVVLVPYL